jgi:lipopolysaccharide export system protein LptA
VAEGSGDAFARGNVKATWTGNGPDAGSRAGAAGGDSLALGGKGPAHAISNEAQLHQAGGPGASSEVTFRGHARLWQDVNSVAAPVIELNRQKQTLTASSTDPAEPVKVVMMRSSGPGTAQAAGGQGSNGRVLAGQQAGTDDRSGKSTAPSVIRVHGGDLWYSDVERRAQMHGAVVADTGGTESISDQVELFLTPAGQPQPSGAPFLPQARVGDQKSQPNSAGAPSQVDRMTATGHVVLTSEGRRGTGQQLTFTSRTGDYVLTGTPAAAPRMTDPQRGTVTGETVIFHSRDNSVSVEGGAQKTRTDTTAPR